MVSDIVFIDRDGPILESHKTIEDGKIFNIHPEEFKYCKRAIESLELLRGECIPTYILTNQAWIEDKDDFIHAYQSNAMIRRLVTDIYITINKAEGESRARTKAAIIFNVMDGYSLLDNYRFWIIGDSQSDIDAGIITGCTTIQVLTKFGDKYKNADYKVNNLFEAVQLILNERGA